MEKLLGLVSKFSLLLAVIFATASIITWIAARAAVVMVAQVLVSTFGGFSVLAGLVAVITFSAWRAGWLSLKLTELSRDKSLAANEGEQADIQTGRAAMHLAAETRLMAATIRQIETGTIHAKALGDGAQFSSFPASIIKEVNSAVPLLEAPPLPLLSAIRDMPNILVIGGKGTGKTTLLQYLESERIQSGQTIALDSHAIPGQWAGQSIGAGRDYKMIKNAMIALVARMDKRHKERTAGKTHFEPIHQFIDEFTLLPGYLKQAGYNIQDYSFAILTEGRKVDCCCLWGSHSDRAEPLGMKGLADLRECFDAIIYLKKVRGDFFAFVDFGEGKEDARYTLPGPFAAHQNAPALLPEPATPTIEDLEFVVAEPEPEIEPEPNMPTDEEMVAIEAFVSVRDSGKFSWRKVTQAAYGPGKFGEGPNKKLRDTLDKFSIDYSEYITK